MKYSIHFTKGFEEGIKALLPQGSKIITESDSCVIVDSNCFWKTMEKIYDGIAIVAKCEQKDPVLCTKGPS